MGDLYGIRDDLDRARALISGGNDVQLAYAALELRFCMEAIAYRQLDSYGPEIRSRLMKEWSPSRIVRMLTLFDEHSDLSAQFSIAVNLPDDFEPPTEEIDPEWARKAKDLGFVPVGNANRIPWKKFSKAYGTVGSFVHLGRDGLRPVPTREKLSTILEMLDEVADSTVIAAMNNYGTATCSCDTLLVLGPKHQSGSELIYCTNDKCKAVFEADPQNPGAMNRIGRLLLTCPCGAKVEFKSESMLGMERCESCNSSVRAHVLSKLSVVPDAY
ncbi:hypothetical protein [Xanthomonas campestris]|uniref:Uncharacterized protein n=1 Tax=Xanthomonas campestris pv. papavericola TaxID=487881 RepID=A0AAJ2X1H4_XANCA|nr:hypothetical protein [Xanthomonas campestris]MEC3887095.1 hypothetical protein [Xanthomonas campestris pv. papavericola]